MMLRKLFLAGSFLLLCSTTGTSAEDLPVLGKIPDFSLTAQTGKPFPSQDLKGRVWVASFLFTRCAGICPMIAAKTGALQKTLLDIPEMRFVSFSVDPEYDTPEVLARYGERFGAVAGRWFLLTGSKEKIYELSLQHFHLGVGEIPLEERPSPDQWVQHSSRFALVDRAGQIRGYYSSEEAESLKKLERDARSLAG